MIGKLYPTRELDIVPITILASDILVVGIDKQNTRAIKVSVQRMFWYVVIVGMLRSDSIAVLHGSMLRGVMRMHEKHAQTDANQIG